MARRSDIIEDHAAEWLIRMEFAGSPRSWAALDSWIATHPRHRAAFLRLSVAWHRAEQLRKLKAFDGVVDEDLLSLPALRARRAAARARRWRRPALAVGLPTAAAAALLAGIYLLLPYALQYLRTEVYTTDVGNRRHIELADGSTVELNTDSLLRVRFTDNSRELTLLRGEAAFKAAHNSARPFEVQAGATTVRAIGTAFSVRLRDPDVEVRVTEGRVAINPPSARVLTPGDTAAVAGNGLVQVRKVPVTLLVNKLAWTQGQLFFSGETLADAVAEFNRYNRRQITIVNAQIAGLRISGKFAATDPDKFAAALDESFGIRILPAAHGRGTDAIRLDGKDPG